MTILTSIAGVLAMLGIGYAFSTARGQVNWRTIGTALVLQAAIAGLVLYVPQGGVVLDAAVRGVRHVLNFAMDGVKFVFGENFEENLGFTVALNVLPVIVFVGALMSVLYYLGIMQVVVGTVGGWLHRLLRTSHPESISAVSNIFVGHTDAPLVIRPYLKGMTESELFAVMVGGCATIASAVMMGFAQLGVELDFDESFPNDTWFTATEVTLPTDATETFTSNLYTTQRDTSYTRPAPSTSRSRT